MNKLQAINNLSKKHLPSNILYTKQDDGSILVVDMENENVFYRIEGSVACDTFQLLAGKKSDDSIIKTLLKKYPSAPEKELIKDFQSFLKKLLKAKVLVVHEE